MKKTVIALQAQLSLQRQKRVTMEEEHGWVLKNSELEQQLKATDASTEPAARAAAGGGDGRDVADVAGVSILVNGVEKLVLDLCLIPFMRLASAC